MKRMIALFLILAMATALFALPAMAEPNVTINIDLTTVPHNTPLKHPKMMVIGMTDTVETPKTEAANMMTQEEMDTVLQAALADPECTLIPDYCTFLPGRITVLESRKISCEESPYFVSFRIWGTANRSIAVFFRAEDSEEWNLVTCGLGTDIQVDLVENGYYAVGVAW